MEVKRFRVVGEIRKPRMKIPFTLEIAALRREDAQEKVYSELGSRHKAKRFEVKMFKIEEVAT